MKRTKLADRVLPIYTKGEEIFNMVSHIVGATMGIAMIVLGIVFSALRNNPYGIASSIVFGVTLILLYTASLYIIRCHDAKATGSYRIGNTRLSFKLFHPSIERRFFSSAFSKRHSPSLRSSGSDTPPKLTLLRAITLRPQKANIRFT